MCAEERGGLGTTLPWLMVSRAAGVESYELHGAFVWVVAPNSANVKCLYSYGAFKFEFLCF